MDENSTVQNNKNLSLSPSSILFLKEIPKWANFLSIIDFIGISLLILVVIFIVFVGVGSVYGNAFGAGMASAGVVFIYIFLALLYFMPIYYLYNFARNMKIALNNNAEISLTRAFEYLKSHYKYFRNRCHRHSFNLYPLFFNSNRSSDVGIQAHVSVTILPLYHSKFRVV